MLIKSSRVLREGRTYYLAESGGVAMLIFNTAEKGYSPYLYSFSSYPCVRHLKFRRLRNRLFTTYIEARVYVERWREILLYIDE
jgi:hypothetical protein